MQPRGSWLSKTDGQACPSASPLAALAHRHALCLRGRVGRERGCERGETAKPRGDGTVGEPTRQDQTQARRFEQLPSDLDDGNDNAKKTNGAAENLHNQNLDKERRALRVSKGSTT